MSDKHSHALDLDKLEALAKSVPDHIQLNGWYVGKAQFGQQYVYADNFKGMGRQHIASLPASKQYFGSMAEYIATFNPATVLQLIAKIRATSNKAERDVLAERRRQVEAEGYDPEHDDAHPNEEIAAYAALYAMPPAARDWPATETGYGDTFGAALCPVDWHPKFADRRRELVKAAALLLAEIERIDRATLTGAV